MIENESSLNPKEARFCTLTDNDCNSEFCNYGCYGIFVANNLEYLNLGKHKLKISEIVAKVLIRPLDGEKRRAVFQYLADKPKLTIYEDFLKGLE